MKSTLFAALLVASAAGAAARAPADPSGHWEGTITAQGSEVRFEIDLRHEPKGTLAGTFSQPAEKLSGLPLSGIVVEGASVTFQIKGSAPGERVFKGSLSADGQTISGDYIQGGHTVPFTMARRGEARLVAAVRSPAVSQNFEGTWIAQLELNGVQRRLAMTLANAADGTSSASLLNEDEGLEIPVSRITQNGRDLTLEFQAISGSFSGALNAAGTELAGTLTQGAAARPITFRRRAAAGPGK